MPEVRSVYEGQWWGGTGVSLCSEKTPIVLGSPPSRRLVRNVAHGSQKRCHWHSCQVTIRSGQGQKDTVRGMGGKGSAHTWQRPVAPSADRAENTRGTASLTRVPGRHHRAGQLTSGLEPARACAKARETASRCLTSALPGQRATPKVPSDCGGEQGMLNVFRIPWKKGDGVSQMALRVRYAREGPARGHRAAVSRRGGPAIDVHVHLAASADGPTSSPE